MLTSKGDYGLNNDNMRIKYLERKKFEVEYRTHKIIVDQPKSKNGDDAGMNPVELFMAAIGSCAGFYGITFLSRRIKILHGLEVEVLWKYSEKPHRVREISLTIKVPDKLSESVRKGLLRSIEYCTVKNTLENPPKILIKLKE